MIKNMIDVPLGRVHAKDKLFKFKLIGYNPFTTQRYQNCCLNVYLGTPYVDIGFSSGNYNFTYPLSFTMEMRKELSDNLIKASKAGDTDESICLNNDFKGIEASSEIKNSEVRIKSHINRHYIIITLNRAFAIRIVIPNHTLSTIITALNREPIEEQTKREVFDDIL